MAREPFGDLMQSLRRMFPSEHGGPTDDDLLNHFILKQDDDAFATLVHRHGRMVLQACLRQLGDFHLAEDAFQATFIVLARQAATLRPRKSLGTWLYGVARRIAMNAKEKAAVMRSRERQSATMPHTEGLDEKTWQELKTIIDEEIGRLPEKYQGPIVLCYLEGKSHKQAAMELGCAKTTLEHRLSRAQEMLRRQLIGRGVTLSVGAFATALGEKVMGAPVGGFLISNTVKAVASIVTGKTVIGGCISATAQTLAEEAMVGMMSVKGKIVVMVLAFGFAIGGGGLAGYGALGNSSQPKAAVKGEPAGNAQPPAVKVSGTIKGEATPRQAKLKTEKRSEHFALNGLDLVQGKIKGSSVATNPERTIFSYRGFWELLVEPTTKITIDGKDAKLADLQKLKGLPNSSDWTAIVDVEAELEVREGAKQTKQKGVAIRIDATGVQERGVLQSINVDKNAITVKKIVRGFDGEWVWEKADELSLAKDVLVTIDNRMAPLADLKPNMKASLQMSAIEDLVLGIQAYGAKVEALLKAVDAKKNAVSVTIPSVQMTVEGVSVAKNAKLVIDGKKGSLSDLMSGMRVTLQMSADPDQSVIIGVTKEKAR